ncbi:MAG: hypothetical protein V1896_02690 [Candidatus Zambryskibacteria bacterium]
MGNKTGFSLVEVLVMVFVATFSVFMIWRVYILYIKISLSNPSIFQASFLAEEGIEAVKFMRDNSWTSDIAPLIPGVFYTLTFDGTVWGTTTTPAFIANRFDRRISVTNVFRDISGNIANSGSPDPNTKKVLVEVSWQKDISTTTRQITTYVSNIFDN